MNEESNQAGDAGQKRGLLRAVLFRYRWGLAAVCVFALLVVAATFSVDRSVNNVMHPALDTLASLPIGDRWSHPEFSRIRALGEDAVPPLRRVLREKDSVTTKILLWLRVKWPGVEVHLSSYPDPLTIEERRDTACQVLHHLGVVGRSAAPELISILRNEDMRHINFAIMALWQVGVEKDALASVERVYRTANSDTVRNYAVSVLGRFGHESPEVAETLDSALSDSSVSVRNTAAHSLGLLGRKHPTVVTGLINMRDTATNNLSVVISIESLRKLDAWNESMKPMLLDTLNRQLNVPRPVSPGGQGSFDGDNVFSKAGEILRELELTGLEQSQALDLFARWIKGADNIWNEIVLIPTLIDLGYSESECVSLIERGLARNEQFYNRIYAARALPNLVEKFGPESISLAELMNDGELGVRVFAAQAHWGAYRNVSVILPILIDALDVNQHQSYYYDALVQPSVISFLGEMGADAEDAASSLESLTQDPNSRIAELAATALKEIRD